LQRAAPLGAGGRPGGPRAGAAARGGAGAVPLGPLARSAAPAAGGLRRRGLVRMPRICACRRSRLPRLPRLSQPEGFPMTPIFIGITRSFWLSVATLALMMGQGEPVVAALARLLWTLWSWADALAGLAGLRLPGG